MRRRRTTRQTLTVSLFPFLAVLICTLGVLIVLLVIAVKAADVGAAEARSVAQQDHQQDIDELNLQYDVSLTVVEGLEQVRPDAVQRLSVARSHRGHLEEEIRQLRNAIRKMDIDLQQLDQPLNLDTMTDFRDRRNELKQQIAATKSALSKKRESLKSFNPVTYSIVPGKRDGGTLRRPIFVECTAEGLVLQPTGIKLKKSEFTPPLESGNMLDSALLAIREYWQRHDLAGTEGSPYPLLVVRPGGEESFGLARRAMKSWDDEFGYELVESDRLLDFGQSDKQLAEIVNQSVNDARNRQRISVARRQATGDRFSVGQQPVQSHRTTGLRASNSQGGFVSSSDWKTSAHRLNNQRKNKTRSASKDAGKKQFVSSERKSISGNQSGVAESDSATSSSGNHLAASTSLAVQRGENWGLPSLTPGATGYVRPIRVVCNDDYFEVRSVLGAEKQIPVRNGDVHSAVDPLVNEIWKQIESWGASGSRSYWKPELRISVLPDGELNFEKLKTLLEDSGIVVKESPR